MTDWIVQTTESLGYLGVALFMFLENVAPPIPSEVVMPFAGFTSKQSELSLGGVMLAGTAGSLAGAVMWYWIGRVIGTERLADWADRRGRWLGIRRCDVERADGWFDAYGKWAVLAGRLIPGIRTLISIPAGFSEMPFGTFLVFTSIGTAAWTALLAWLGWYVGEKWRTVADYTGWAAAAVGCLLAGWAILWIWRRREQVRL